MDRDELSRLAHARHPVAAPLSDGAVDGLLARAGDPRSVLDLGCGQGAWLVRALARWPAATATGVDTSPGAITAAREAAVAAGVADRLTLHETPAAELDGPVVDLVLSVGATHAFGGLAPTAAAVRSHLDAGGLAVVGEGFWTREPPAAALAALDATPADFADLAGTVDAVEAAGFVTVDAHVSSQAEWDAYEWSWTGSLLDWASSYGHHPDAAEVEATARAHRDGWLRGYRGVLGFVTFVLRAR